MALEEHLVLHRKNKAFTLIELLVVIAIISLLVSILLPSLTKAKDLAKKTVCGTNLKAMSTAFAMYQNDWDGCFPDAYWMNGTWCYLLVPYLSDKDCNNEDNGQDSVQNMGVFRCPSEEDLEVFHYARNLDLGFNRFFQGEAEFHARRQTSININQISHPAMTGLVGDDGGDWWFSGNPYWTYEGQPRYRHIESCMMLFVDSHAEGVDYIDFVNGVKFIEE